MSDLRAQAQNIFDKAIEAASPRNLSVSWGDNFDKDHKIKKLHIVALGKASIEMTQAAIESVTGEMAREMTGKMTGEIEIMQPLVITHEAMPSPLIESWGARILRASHPIPDHRSVAAAHALVRHLSAVPKNEGVLLLISGGGSALVCLPAETINLEDKVKTTELLFKVGADIKELNCIRKHLSQIKGGWLAKKTKAPIHALIISDVFDDDPSAIASGVVSPDPTNFADARSIIEKYNLWEELPFNVQRHIEAGFDKKIDDTPKNNDDCFDKVRIKIVGSNRISVARARQEAGSNRSDNPDWIEKGAAVTGEARNVAANFVTQAKKIMAKKRQQTAIITGGETTVTIKGTGKGGRNQEMALAVALEAERQGLSGEWVFLSGGTDGRDGPTDAAGGIVDGGTLGRMRERAIDPQIMLNENDSYHALKISGDLLMTGATGTNVADIQIMILKPSP